MNPASSASSAKKPMPKDEDSSPNDADDLAGKVAKRKKLIALVAGGAGMKGPC